MQKYDNIKNTNHGEIIMKHLLVGNGINIQFTREIFGKVFYGFRRNKYGIVEAIPDKATVVRMIFLLYLNGNSLEDIQQYLFKTQLPSPSGKEKWSRDVLNKLLNNYKYTFGIVSYEMFEAVENLKENNCRNPNRSVEDEDGWDEQQEQNYCGLLQ